MGIELKTCTRCNEAKILSGFSKHKDTRDGLHTICKTCINTYNKTYLRTKRGFVNTIYFHQKQNSIKRGHPQPNYTKEELKEWTLSQPNFQELWNNWIANGYLTKLKPSCDRLDDYKPYMLSNLRLVTWEENYRKHHRDRKNGFNNKSSKAVIATNIKTGISTEYYSAAQAERELGIGNSKISEVCIGLPIRKGELKNGNTKYSTPRTAGGYFWEFKEVVIQESI